MLRYKMNYPEYIYIDYAIGGVKYRNKVTTIEEATKTINSVKLKSEIHVSIYQYTEDFLKYFLSNKNSVAGYRGSCISNYIVFDIDRGTPEQSRMDAKTLADILVNFYGIDCMKIFYSGSKGFHIVFSSGVIKDLKPSKDFPLIMRHFCQRVADNIVIDLGLYQHVSLLRMPNTINMKSGHYKVRIKYEEMDLPMTEIQKLSKSERYVEDTGKVIPNEELTKLWNEAIKEVEKANERILSKPEIQDGIPINQKLCIHHLFTHGADKGQRHNVILRLAEHEKKAGKSEEAIVAELWVWHQQFNPDSDYKLSQIKSTVRSLFDPSSKVDYGCFDPVLDAVCESRCFLYKSVKMKAKADTEKKETEVSKYKSKIMTVNLRMERYKNLMLYSKWIDISKLFPSFVRKLRLTTALTKYWLSFTNVGKTTVKINYNRTIKELQLNYDLEMSPGFSAEREIMSSLETDNDGALDVLKNSPSDLNKVVEEFKHVFSTDESLMSVKVMEEYYWYMTQDFLPDHYNVKEAVKIPIVNIDNFGDIDGKGTQQERASHKVLQLGTFAKRTNTLVNIFAHVSRDKAEDGKKRPTLASGKDTSLIENKADIVLGLWRPDDETMKVAILKNRLGPAGAEVSCDYIGKHQIIRETKANQGLKNYEPKKEKAKSKKDDDGDDLPF